MAAITAGTTNARFTARLPLFEACAALSCPAALLVLPSGAGDNRRRKPGHIGLLAGLIADLFRTILRI